MDLKRSDSKSISLPGYLRKTLLIVLPLAAIISLVTGVSIGIENKKLILYLFTNTSIALVLVLLTSSRNYFRYIKPSVVFVEVLRKIVLEHDLTGRIQNISKAEIGEIERYFNLFIDDIQSVMKEIYVTTLALNKSYTEFSGVASNIIENRKSTNEKTNIVNETIEKIASNIENTASALSDTSNSMKTVTTSVSNMSETAVSLAAISEQTSSAVGQVTDIVAQISGSINNVSSSTQEVSTSINSVATAVKEINLSLNEISKNCERSMHITSDAEANAKATNIIIERLNNSSKQIGKIVNVINDIADQTNMLALNAAIEAAGAGEAGKGFAVVANEVKELAKQTAEATDEISGQIEAMQHNMLNAVKSVGTINEVISEMTTITNTIASAVTEQTAITGDISNAVLKAAQKASYITKDIGAIAANTQNVTQSLSEASEGVKDFANSSRNLSIDSSKVLKSTELAYAKIQDITSVTYEISKCSNGIYQNMYEINLVSNELTASTIKTSNNVKTLLDMAEILEKLVKQYKI